MGRGRAKAKQTKVARELKYRSFDPDFNELERELRGDDDSAEAHSSVDEVEDDQDVDEYSDEGSPRSR